jgi:hypothetical protein
MTIIISVGKAGSGKTLEQVYNILNDKSGRMTYSNINVFDCPHTIQLKPDMILTKIEDGKKTKYEVNEEFWRKAKKPLCIILDEAHNLIDSRSAMSSINKGFSSWQSAIRRLTSEDSENAGDLTYITQLPNALDNRTRDLATEINYHVCHFIINCENCGYWRQESTEIANPLKKCPFCENQKFKKTGHVIEVFKFTNYEEYLSWFIGRKKTYSEHYTLENLGWVMKKYNTLQWDNLFKTY